MNSEDMSFHFKFVDVINNTANNYIDDGQGYIDVGRFVKWWYMDIDTLMAKDEKPPEGQ
jgi:hypothetical protein